MVAFLLLMALLRPVAQTASEVKLFSLHYSNQEYPPDQGSNNLSGVKNTHETIQLLKRRARNPLSLDLKEKKNEHLCFTFRTSFRLKDLLHT